MTITPHPELIRRLADDFTALQDAVLTDMNGVCAPEIAAALEDAALVGPVTVVLAHTDVLARGAVRRAELSQQPPERLRHLRAHARRVRRARSQAEARYKKERARRIGSRSRPLDSLELRVARVAFRPAYDESLRQELRGRGLPDGTPQAPEGDLVRWAWERETGVRRLPARVRELCDGDDEDFVRALLLDAREEENPYLQHDAVVERWARHTRTALAWGRYAIGQAEREAAACAPAVRRTRLEALDDAYQDAAVLAARCREAQLRTTDLHDRMQTAVVTGPGGELVGECRAAALARFAEAQPEAWHRVRELTTRHRVDCPEQADGCPHCHHALATVLADSLPDGTDEDDDAGRPDEDVDVTYGDRYALLTDLPDSAVVAVADAAAGGDSALCGYGWAAEDGATGHGDSLASSSGEAEVIGVCAAALSLLDHHEDAPVVVLCDSVQAVKAVDTALGSGDAETARRVLVFPEGRELLHRLVRHRHRVQVRWLKGHVGHELNEAADALARFAFRRVTGRIPSGAVRREETRILRSLGREPGPLAAAA
ncbi:RNase H family protein [Streptomyces sp. JHA26]|uniref:RNase H family protein n=1 Tax=Streptomyces sp. JHA26 TaxID=1917143 RepID=UPI00098A8617|nr:RNase H family protein [Streptomyces sp. JHA26]